MPDFPRLNNQPLQRMQFVSDIILHNADKRGGLLFNVRKNFPDTQRTQLQILSHLKMARFKNRHLKTAGRKVYHSNSLFRQFLKIFHHSRQRL